MKYVIRIGIAVFFLSGIWFMVGSSLLRTSSDAPQDGHSHDHNEMRADSVLSSVVEDGVQVAQITVDRSGYSHARVTFNAGVPARLVFIRTEEGGCTDSIRIPFLGVEATDLPIGEAVSFEFTPEDTDTFNFACGMDMVTGTVVVEG